MNLLTSIFLHFLEAPAGEFPGLKMHRATSYSFGLSPHLPHVMFLRILGPIALIGLALAWLLIAFFAGVSIPLVVITITAARLISRRVQPEEVFLRSIGRSWCSLQAYLWWRLGVG